MSAHQFFVGGPRVGSRKTEDDGTDQNSGDAQSFVDYYSANLAQAIDYLADMQRAVDDYPEREVFGEEVTSRADAARQWVDVIDSDDRLRAPNLVAIADHINASVSGRSRNAVIEALRKRILEVARSANQVYQASRARPW